MTFGTNVYGKHTDKFLMKYCLSVKGNFATVQNVHVLFDKSNVGRICTPVVSFSKTE